MLVPRQSEYPRAPGPLPYHMQHASHSGMPNNAGFSPSSYSQHNPPSGPGRSLFKKTISDKLLQVKFRFWEENH